MENSGKLQILSLETLITILKDTIDNYLYLNFKVAFNLMMLELCVKCTIEVNEIFVSMLISMLNCEKICSE